MPINKADVATHEIIGTDEEEIQYVNGSLMCGIAAELQAEPLQGMKNEKVKCKAEVLKGRE